MDENEKGVLSKEQFERALGYCHIYLNNQELETVMSHYDLKHDGTLSYEEFLTGMRGSLNARRKLLVGALFRKIAGYDEAISLEVHPLQSVISCTLDSSLSSFCRLCNRRSIQMPTHMYRMAQQHATKLDDR